MLEIDGKRTPNGAVSIAPYHYAHILDLNTNVERLIIGPKVYVCQENERIAGRPKEMVHLGPMEYCIIVNPVAKDSDGTVMVDSNGFAKIRLGEREYRYNREEPFPLYPGELLDGEVMQLPVVKANSAIRLKALCNYVEEDSGVERHAGDEWQFERPGFYYPRVEVAQLGVITATVITPNSALKVKALQNCVDRRGIERKFGEEWLVEAIGAYLPTVYEKIIDHVAALKLDEKTAAHVKAIRSHVDRFGRKRECGDEWLVTYQETSSYLVGVDEILVEMVSAIMVNCQECYVIENPVDSDGKSQLGKKKHIVGETCFFLHPGEKIQPRIKTVYTLEANHGLLLKAVEEIEDIDSNGQKVVRSPGERWMVYGPTQYTPPVGVEVLIERRSIPLSKCEGIYVRNIYTGEVRIVSGSAYMLTQDEEHWEKVLQPDFKELLTANLKRLNDNEDDLEDENKFESVPVTDVSEFEELHKSVCFASCPIRDDYMIDPEPFPVVSFQVPHNAAVRVTDSSSNSYRIEFGPLQVQLGPHEDVTVLTLSAGIPKRTNALKMYYLLLGPDYVTDRVYVETADHARLTVHLAYNWHFDVPSKEEEEGEAAKLFAVPDFIGDLCKTMASRIRGSVSSVSFDVFHKSSAKIVQEACMGMDDNGEPNIHVLFPKNRLCVSSVDIKSVSPSDEHTQSLLARSVQLAIEITTKSQEAAARHEAARVEQEALGRLERQRIADALAVEQSRKKLVKFKVASEAMEAKGKETALALGIAETMKVEAETAVRRSKRMAEANQIDADAKLNQEKCLHEAELALQAQRNDLKLERQRKLAELETLKFQELVKAVGSENMHCLSTMESTHSLRLLESMGLQSSLITDGCKPINLISTACGLVGGTPCNTP